MNIYYLNPSFYIKVTYIYYLHYFALSEETFENNTIIIIEYT